MSRVVYLSGPISMGGLSSNEEIGRRIDVFTREAQRLRDAGYEVINPCECDAQESWEDYMRIHLPSVCRADVVVTLPDWERSRGSRLEVLVARELQTEVVPVEAI